MTIVRSELGNEIIELSQLLFGAVFQKTAAGKHRAISVRPR
jgi:hypothetical protein